MTADTKSAKNIDWTNDEVVVRAAAAAVGCLAMKARGTIVGNYMGYELELGKTWREARKHSSVKFFERAHNPALSASAEPTGQVSGIEALIRAARSWHEFHHAICDALPKAEKELLAIRARPSVAAQSWGVSDHHWEVDMQMGDGHFKSTHRIPYDTEAKAREEEFDYLPTHGIGCRLVEVITTRRTVDSRPIKEFPDAR